ncbi:helix-turn-helix transcriptional regulator [Providencia rettgeri]|uniref:helix-turn-helix domain-containing protein n=1 Tax=Providencia TaxID=586 RepID=UPI000C7EAA97|nr:MULTISPECIES: helix-turn-helix transcriptional regulator [Providencia]MBJ9969408.1 helix-turn-helix transcriptional regulator [Providencia rettgeri]MBS0914424.1 helix-turn-helix transcriptional regulator [Providencia rettgeri]MCB6144529.1 helix-turn-helix domain-containing protein [Providencia rettgeri]MCF8961456.1 hypothetical protein [Providencia rettgeri]UDQ65531.1 helix-turn-helix domain-containing protein [Providencia rettgeri]
MDNKDDEMLLLTCSERIKSSILSNFTYDDIENETGISARTLKRLAAGERDPKINEIREIARATGKNPIWLAFGDLNTTLGEHAYFFSSDKVGVNFPEHTTLDVADRKMRVLTAVTDLPDEDVAFIERFIDLLNLDRTISKVKNKRYQQD